MNEVQKANAVAKALEQLEGEYRQENRPAMGDRLREVRVLVMASPDSAARLFDIIQKVGS